MTGASDGTTVLLTKAEIESLRVALGWDWDEEPDVPSVSDCMAELLGEVERILAARLAAQPPQDDPARQAGAALHRVLAACDLAEAQGRHVVDDESMVATGVVRWAVRPIFAADADVTVYWPDVRPTYDRAALAEPTPRSES